MTSGLVLGLKKDKSNEQEETVDVLNSYDNTEELIQKFQVKMPTTIKEGIEKKIQNRLLTGFENLNRGFKAWKVWGNILYTEYSIYNVHGTILSLAHYQDAMMYLWSKQIFLWEIFIICSFVVNTQQFIMILLL